MILKITKVEPWEGFLEEVNRYRFDDKPKVARPQFVVKDNATNEEDVRFAMDGNICLVLNRLFGTVFKFSRRTTYGPGIPDFSCHDSKQKLILVIEAKRELVLEDMGEQTFPEFYYSSDHAKMVIQQVYNYMAENELQYGVLSTYKRQWFLKRPKEKPSQFFISKALECQSESPPVLKSYAYLALLAKADPKSRHHNVLEETSSESQDPGKRVTIPFSKIICIT
jgi:hypothetical protein